MSRLMIIDIRHCTNYTSWAHIVMPGEVDIRAAMLTRGFSNLRVKQEAVHLFLVDPSYLSNNDLTMFALLDESTLLEILDNFIMDAYELH